MIIPHIMSLLMMVGLLATLMIGFPVALTLMGVAVGFAALGSLMGAFDGSILSALPSRIYGIATNDMLVAIPQFIFMGLMLESSKVADGLLTTMAQCFGKFRAGLGLSVILVGGLLAASTGIVGATVVTMGLVSLPTMLKAGYDPKLACGTIAASGTLGQIIPPSIVLVMLSDSMAGSYMETQTEIGNFMFDPFSALDLFAGGVLPGLMLMGLYGLWVIVLSYIRPQSCPAQQFDIVSTATLALQVIKVLIPPLALILTVLGSILAGIATPTEAASFGAIGATVIAFFRGRITRDIIYNVSSRTAMISAMVFSIIIGATVFSLTFRGFDGDQMVANFLQLLPGGSFGIMVFVMVLIFILGFFLDFIEIIFIVVPIVAPALFLLGISPVWLGVMIGLNLQTSFLTPPFGWALFYLRGVTPDSITTGDIYRGVTPFVALQLIGLLMVATFPGLATWLPNLLL